MFSILLSIIINTYFSANPPGYMIMLLVIIYIFMPKERKKIRNKVKRETKRELKKQIEKITK